jgi:hypothetical protein
MYEMPLEIICREHAISKYSNYIRQKTRSHNGNGFFKTIEHRCIIIHYEEQQCMRWRQFQIVRTLGLERYIYCMKLEVYQHNKDSFCCYWWLILGTHCHIWKRTIRNTTTRLRISTQLKNTFGFKDKKNSIVYWRKPKPKSVIWYLYQRCIIQTCNGRHPNFYSKSQPYM